MAESSNNSVRRSTRLRSKIKVPLPIENETEEQPKIKRKKVKKQNSVTLTPESSENSTSPKVSEPEELTNINEVNLSEFNLPELHCPQEWSKLLESEVQNESKNMDIISHDSDSSASGSEWVDVEVPSTSAQPVKVVVEQKPHKWEKLIRQEINRSLRERDEDLHMLSIAGHMTHLRFHMSCAVLTVEGFDNSDNKFPSELPDADDLEATLNEFAESLKNADNNTPDCKKWKKADYCERYKEVLNSLSYANTLELTILFLAFFIYSNNNVRICMGFKPLPEWPTVKKPKTAVKERPTNPMEEFRYWIEYFDSAQKRWISVNPKSCTIDDPKKMEEMSTVNYVLAVDKDLKVKDVTARYASTFLTTTFRKARAPDILPIAFRPPRKDDLLEDNQLKQILLGRPMPTVVSEFKNHPLYVLEKDLLKFEAIYPSDIQPLGTVRGHKIYPRGSGELNWIRQARSVKKDEAPFKVVKARPKLSIPAEERVPLFLNVYGYWQTEPYCVPKVENGQIPRNEYGNVYMYQPSMLPEGCKHIKQRGVLQMARTLGLQAVPAVVGWEFSGGRNHPLIDGCIVLTEDAPILSNACTELEKVRSEKQIKAAENRSLQLWSRFFRGVLLYEKMRKRVQIRGS